MDSFHKCEIQGTLLDDVMRRKCFYFVHNLVWTVNFAIIIYYEDSFDIYYRNSVQERETTTWNQLTCFHTCSIFSIQTWNYILSYSFTSIWMEWNVLWICFQYQEPHWSFNWKICNFNVRGEKMLSIWIRIIVRQINWNAIFYAGWIDNERIVNN